jgi:protein-tyrosine phosphatase
MDRFYKVTDGLYRGGKPTPEEVSSVLKDVFDINKIISLDQECGNSIDDVCKKLNIEHITLDLGSGDGPNVDQLISLIPTLLNNGPTYIHCRHGKDRTGMTVAMFRIYNGWDVEKALNEAKNIGMGTDLDPQTAESYYQAVRNYANQDNNNGSDIVEITRENNPFGTNIPNPFINNFSPDRTTDFSPLSRMAFLNSFLVKKSQTNKIYRKCTPAQLLNTMSTWFKTKDLALNNSNSGILYSAIIDNSANVKEFGKNIIDKSEIGDDVDIVNFNKDYFLVVYPSILIDIQEEDSDVNNIAEVGMRDNSTDYSSFGPYSGSGVGGMPEGAAGFGTLPFTGPGQV